MKRKKHKPEQIIKKLREADAMLAVGKTIGQVAQALEVSEQTFHRWRNQYGGMKAEEAKRLKEILGSPFVRLWCLQPQHDGRAFFIEDQVLLAPATFL